jgi:hypothetical protein
MWIEHGGSGLGLTYADTEAIDWADIRLLLRRMDEQKRREADAIKSARGSR